MQRPRLVPLAHAALAALLALGAPQGASARGGAAAAGGLAPNDALGAALVAQAARAIGAPEAPATSLVAVSGRGRLRLAPEPRGLPLAFWWHAPDRLRLETGEPGDVTVRLLDGPQGWIVPSGGAARRLHGTPEGREALARMRADASRLADVARWITLRGATGPGVRFTFEGERAATADLPGRWLQVTRTAPGERALRLWLAAARDPAGRYRAGPPGLVRVYGDPARGVPTEDYRLSAWSPAGRGPRHPGRIDGVRHVPGRAPEPFLHLDLEALATDAAVGPVDFRPADGPPR